MIIKHHIMVQKIGATALSIYNSRVHQTEKNKNVD